MNFDWNNNQRTATITTTNRAVFLGTYGINAVSAPSFYQTGHFLTPILFHDGKFSKIIKQRANINSTQYNWRKYTDDVKMMIKHQNFINS